MLVHLWARQLRDSTGFSEPGGTWTESDRSKGKVSQGLTLILTLILPEAGQGNQLEGHLEAFTRITVKEPHSYNAMKLGLLSTS